MDLNKDEELARVAGADAARLAAMGMAGMAVFVALVAVLHVIDPDRDPISITVSEYVLGPHGYLLTFAATAFGLGMLAVAASVAAVLPPPRPRVALGLLATAGLGMVVVGAFPTDPIDPTDPRFVTTAGSIHAVAGIVSFTCLAFAAPLLGRRVAAAAGSVAVRRLAAAPPVGYALFWLTGLLDNQLGGLVGERSATGLGERVMAAAFLAWLLVVGVAVRRSSAGRPGAPIGGRDAASTRPPSRRGR